MKNLLRNSLIASVVAVAGVVSGANNAMAVDSDPIEFTATIPASCTFGTPTSGILVDFSGTDYANLYTGFSRGGQTATISLECNTGANIEVKELQEEIPDGMTRITEGIGNVTIYSEDTGDYTELHSDGTKTSPITRTIAFSEDLTVYLDLYYEETLKPGTYTYKTIITATPQ